MRSPRIGRSLNLGFGIVFGFLVFRLMLGPNYHYPALYTHFVWIILYPINQLRNISNRDIYLLFYVLFWSYIIVVKTLVYDKPFRSILLVMLVWMPLVALPFLPFGIEYFSLARYSIAITNYVLRLLPFIALLVVLFLANRLLFGQNYLLAGIWSLTNFLVIIVIITLADLLPLIKSQFFFNALDYRVSLANDFIAGMPILALVISVVLAVFYVHIFEHQFLGTPRPAHSLTMTVTPLGILVACSLVLMIMRDDFRKYRYFDYKEGISTVYFDRYEGRQLLTFDDHEIKLSSGRYSVFYPFGKFDIKDTLRQHIEDITHMKLIEGLDYYRLERIVKIIAHGPHDSLAYDNLSRVLDQKRYRLPEEIEFWDTYLDRRYRVPANDIIVSGCIKVNGRPLNNTDFFVNKISLVGRKIIEPIWQDKTDAQGRFNFSCYKDTTLDSVYFQVSLLVQEKLFGKTFGSLKINNPIPVFSKPETFALDTVKIQTGQNTKSSAIQDLDIRTSSAMDSVMLFLPDIDPGTSMGIVFSVKADGSPQDIVLDSERPLPANTLKRIRKRVSGWRFYLEDSEGRVEIQID